MNLERYPRVALFTDTLNETTTELNAFARQHNLPLLVVQGPNRPKLREALTKFRADVIHAVHPGDLGLMGTYCAWTLQVPLVLSWEANLPAEGLISQVLLNGLSRFPGLAQVLLAPNEDIASVLQRTTGLPVHVIPPAVNSTLFAPIKRVYADGVLRIGYAGSLSSKSNVYLLPELERSLRGNLTRPFRFLIVGEGAERSWLKNNLKDAEFAGDLGGESLARAIARMDIFAYTPDNDVTGDPIMKAMASGVPAVAMAKGAPRFLLEHAVSGFTSRTGSDFNG
jgi:phosphatidylinositol alpha 1,6-mannosyltransferase